MIVPSPISPPGLTAAMASPMCLLHVVGASEELGGLTIRGLCATLYGISKRLKSSERTDVQQAIEELVDWMGNER